MPPSASSSLSTARTRAGSPTRRSSAACVARTGLAGGGAAGRSPGGISDSLRAVEGAGMAALIREPPRRRPDGPLRRVSLRASVDELDVSAIARKSGGGGHRQAAGFSSDATIDEITEFVRREYLAGRAQPVA